MSIVSDLRGYADTAVTQGRQVLDTASTQARENVADIAGKAGGAVADVRHSAEKAINLDALTTAVEPYVAQLRQYSTTVTDRVNGVVAGVRSDKRVAKLVDTAESVSGVVVATVTERVVKPVRSLTGRSTRTGSGTATRKPTPKPAAAKPARKAASTKPATKPTSKPATGSASKPAARKAPAKRTGTSS